MPPERKASRVETATAGASAKTRKTALTLPKKRRKINLPSGCLECGICFEELLTYEIYSCLTCGQLYCQLCARQTCERIPCLSSSSKVGKKRQFSSIERAKCPTCRFGYMRRNKFAEQLRDGYYEGAKFPNCPYAYNGCEVKAIPYLPTNGHISSCPHRQVVCANEWCDVRSLPLSSLMDNRHLVDEGCGMAVRPKPEGSLTYILPYEYRQSRRGSKGRVPLYHRDSFKLTSPRTSSHPNFPRYFLCFSDEIAAAGLYVELYREHHLGIWRLTLKSYLDEKRVLDYKADIQVYRPAQDGSNVDYNYPVYNFTNIIPLPRYVPRGGIISQQGFATCRQAQLSDNEAMMLRNGDVLFHAVISLTKAPAEGETK